MKYITLTLILWICSFVTSPAQSWTAQNSNTSNDIWGVSFASTNTGWVSGSGGTILTTSNGGTSWAVQNSGVTTTLRHIFFINSQNGWAVGDSGVILHTTDGGASWNHQNSNTYVVLREVFFINNSLGWICGASGTILHTQDGGANWSTQSSGTNIVSLMSLKFTDANNGWIVGSNGSSTPGLILHTANGGNTWTQQTGPNNANLNATSFTDSLNGWAGGNTGNIFGTTDSGKNWTVQTTNSVNTIRGMSFPDKNHGWAVCDAGVILTTTNGSNSWSAQNSGTANILRKVFFIDAGNGWAVGNAGTILKYSAAPLGATATVTHVNCFGYATGSINVTATGGVAPYTHKWSNAGAGSVISALTAGTYTDTIRDLLGTTYLLSVTITQPAALTSSTASTPVVNGNDGTASAFASGGTAPYTYLWSNNAQTQAINGLAAGTYYVTITDSLLCTVKDTAVVGMPNAIAPAPNAPNIFTVYPNPANGQISIHATEPVKVKILNLQGQIIATRRSATKHIIDLPLPGVYIIETGTGNALYRQRIVSR